MKTILNRTAIQQDFFEQMDQDKLLNCMRCGFCLPTCPTYIASGHQETHSPRGRIALMKAVTDGLIEPDEDFYNSINLCLDCRACEAVCPSGVQYGDLLEKARDILNKHRTQSFKEKTIRTLTVRGLFPYQNRLSALTQLVSFYQSAGLPHIVHALHIMKLFPQSLGMMEEILPPIREYKKSIPDTVYCDDIPQQKKMKVGFFAGCLMDTMFKKTNSTTEILLKIAGCEIFKPKHQNCCGALHGHSSEAELAKKLAKRNIIAFEQEEIDYIVSNAGGCEGFLSEYPKLLKDEPEWLTRAESFSSKLRDISWILVQNNILEKSFKMAKKTRITYQDSCHLQNIMKITSEPRELLNAIENVELIEMEERVGCCGSAGIYNMVHPNESMAILDKKMAKIEQLNITKIITVNPGCFLQMQLGVKRAGLDKIVQVESLTDFLLEAYQQK